MNTVRWTRRACSETQENKCSSTPLGKEVLRNSSRNCIKCGGLHKACWIRRACSKTEKVLANSSRDCIARVVDQGSMPAETEDVDAGLGRNASCRAGTGAGPPQHAQQQDGHTCLQQHYNCMPAAVIATARQPGDTGTGGSLSAPSPAASAGQQPPQGCPGQPRYRTCELCKEQGL